MHLFGHLQRIVPPWLAGCLFALGYALALLGIIALAPLTPAEFDYGRY